MNRGADQPGASGGVGPDSNRTEPTEDERAAAAAVLRMICGIHVSRAVYVAAELGLADRLADGQMTSAGLAEATHTHEPSLYRVLRVLASLGVLTEDADRSFGLTLLGERLRTDVPASMRSSAMLVESLGGVRAFEPIIETVRTGTPGVDVAHGMSVFEFVETHPQLAQGIPRRHVRTHGATGPAERHEHAGVHRRQGTN